MLRAKSPLSEIKHPTSKRFWARRNLNSHLRWTGEVPFHMELGLALQVVTFRQQVSLAVLKKTLWASSENGTEQHTSDFCLLPFAYSAVRLAQSHCCCWVRDRAASRGACGEQSCRREHPRVPGSSLQLPTFQPPSTRGVVDLCPLQGRRRGLEDVSWRGGERAVPQPAALPGAVSPASSDTACLALPRADKMWRLPQIQTQC